MQELMESVKEKVKAMLAHAEGGHDWFHIERVIKNAMEINKEEGGREDIVYLGALLHDVSDAKFNGGDLAMGGRVASQIMREVGIDNAILEEVVHIVNHLSFAGGRKVELDKSLEFAIVQDADRLDALGAIGIARAFHYGGYKDRLLYDPGQPPQIYDSPQAYYASKAPTINHFYEKLLLLKDRMNTPTGKKLAEQRHAFMLTFLMQFYEEWG
jgi:uncharacterized protein